MWTLLEVLFCMLVSSALERAPNVQRFLLVWNTVVLFKIVYVLSHVTEDPLISMLV